MYTHIYLIGLIPALVIIVFLNYGATKRWSTLVKITNTRLVLTSIPAALMWPLTIVSGLSYGIILALSPKARATRRLHLEFQDSLYGSCK